MASKQLTFELVSPEKLLFSGVVTMVVVPGSEGNFGVLAEHAPLISTIRPGVLRAYEGAAVTQEVFVTGGIAEVTQERCTVLANDIIALKDIDRSAAERDSGALTQALMDVRDPVEREEIRTRLDIANAKLQATA